MSNYPKKTDANLDFQSFLSALSGAPAEIPPMPRKTPRPPGSAETSFLPQPPEIMADVEPSSPPPPFHPKEEKGADTNKLSGTTAPVKTEKITLSHISIRPQFTLEQLIDTMIRENASDLHISSGYVPSLRLHGTITKMELPDLDLEKTEELLYPLLTDEQRAILEDEGDVDFSFDYKDNARFRVNYYRHQKGIGGVFRYIPIQVPRIEQLGLPPVVKNLLKFKKGLILVAGPSGSGKSTTMASMLNEINQTRKLRILTLENPVEYIIRSDLSLVSQRELGTSTLTYQDALWDAMREDPDVIMVSEVWDADDIKSLLTISETGHLVIASVRTVDSSKAVERMVDSFPTAEHEHIRIMVAESLIGIISQQLIPRADGKGRILASEILLKTTGLANIIREGKFSQISSVIQTGRDVGMQTMDQALVELINAKLISPDEAKNIASDDRFFKRAGIRLED